MVRISRLLLLVLLVSFAACDVEESNNEQMVNLQQVKDEPEAQLANLTAAIARSKRDGSLYARRAVVLLRKGELAQALEDANEAVKLTKNEPSSLFVKAQVLRALGKPEEALPLALRAERNSYQSSSLYVLLSELYLQQKDFGQAQTYINKAQELSPEDEFAFYYKGRILEATGDTARAIRNYELALEQAPTFMEPKRELAGVLVSKAEYAAAVPYLREALEQAPEDGLLWYYRGLAYEAGQKQDSATIAFTKAVRLHDTLDGAHYKLGMGYHALGKNELALEHLEKAYAAYKSKPGFLITLASAYERTGQYKSSLAAYQRLVAAEPKYTYAYEAIGRLKSKLAKPAPDSTTVRQVQIEQ
ncbi:tetratricopeptide repeat protein [Pontibacter ummariensis]|uniref:Tetratricopeptide repeat-containing protein n=1 Tax=Pontibacter ummariensis TaxID=1610492 RepID=A0A239FTN5_9BACT|nr:tetratricopeptide repeat protein [Pontibacter ummariensis]PRY11951.1 tetratricopeptide repeat protein [Pontibacter ummariensis]SNS59563.1 Tetratricopeptide repeat-containing protein [Pontibacter ummariensis]